MYLKSLPYIEYTTTSLSRNPRHVLFGGLEAWPDFFVTLDYIRRLASTLQIREHYVFTILNTSCEIESLRS